MSGAENRFTAGFAYLVNPVKDRKTQLNNIMGSHFPGETPFAALERSLFELEKTTGLLKIETIPGEVYHRKLKEINDALAKFVRSDQKEISFTEDMDYKEIPVVLPIYSIKEKEIEEISFNIPKALIASRTYHTILSLYAQMSFVEMETEIKRKINVISFWRKERKAEKESIQYNLEKGKYQPIPGQYREDPDFFVRTLSPGQVETYGYYAKYGINDDYYRGLRTRELIHQFVAWDDRIGQLESGINADGNFIKFYKEQLGKIEQFRKDSGDSSFEDELIDIMLRKWDLGFKFEKLKNLFDQWVEEVRPSVWTFVEERLKGQDLELSFTSIPNLWFEVTRDPQRQNFHVTPKVVVNANNLKITRGKNLLRYGGNQKSGALEMASGDNLNLKDIANHFRELLSYNYEDTIELFIKKSRELLQYNPRYTFDIAGMMSGIEEKAHFGEALSLWGRCLEEGDYEEALDVLDELEEDFGKGKLPEIYFWRALVYAKQDADIINYKNSLMPGYGYRTGNFTKLPYGLLFDYIIGGNRIKENEDLCKAIKQLIGRTNLKYRENVIRNVKRIEKIDRIYYEGLLKGVNEFSTARKKIEKMTKMSEDEKRFYHFYQAVELYKTLLDINEIFTRADGLAELRGKALEKSYKSLKGKISNVTVPYFVEADMIKLLGNLVTRDDSDEMYMKIFFASEIEVILDHIYLQCIENLKIAYRNNPGDKIICDFLCYIYMRSINFKEAFEVLFPDRFPMIFSSAVEFSSQSECLTYQKGDSLDISYSNGNYVFTLARDQKEIQLGKYRYPYEDDTMKRFKSDISGMEFLPSLTYKWILSRMPIDVSASSREELFTILEENLNDLIRALVYGEYKLIDESVFKSIV